MKPTIFCQDITALQSPCCVSCHEDEEEGYEDLFDSWSYETYNLHLCCRMKSYWKSLSDEDRDRVLVRKTS